MATPFALSAELVGHQSDVRAVSAMDDGYIATASRDRSVRIWRLVDGEWSFMKDMKDHTNYVSALGFGAGNRLVRCVLFSHPKISFQKVEAMINRRLCMIICWRKRSHGFFSVIRMRFLASLWLPVEM